MARRAAAGSSRCMSRPWGGRVDDPIVGEGPRATRARGQVSGRPDRAGTDREPQVPSSSSRTFALRMQVPTTRTVDQAADLAQVIHLHGLAVQRRRVLRTNETSPLSTARRNSTWRSEPGGRPCPPGSGRASSSRSRPRPGPGSSAHPRYPAARSLHDPGDPQATGAPCHQPRRTHHGERRPEHIEQHPRVRGHDTARAVPAATGRWVRASTSAGLLAGPTSDPTAGSTPSLGSWGATIHPGHGTAASSTRSSAQVCAEPTRLSTRCRTRSTQRYAPAVTPAGPTHRGSERCLLRSDLAKRRALEVRPSVAKKCLISCAPDLSRGTSNAWWEPRMGHPQAHPALLIGVSLPTLPERVGST